MEKKIKEFLSGSGSGSGAGDGAGSADGSGDGYSYGADYGGKILSFSGKRVHYIDDMPCVFNSVHDTWACISIIDKKDCSLLTAFVAKGNGFFAHGETIKKAFSALQSKLFASMDIEDKKQEFFKKFPVLFNVYKTQDFFVWHNIITGSCEFGRTQFADEKNIDLNGQMSLADFFTLTRDEYRSDIIKALEAMY